MKSLVLLVALTLVASPCAATGAAFGGQHRHADQRDAFEARRDGRILPLREIEARVIPQMPGAQYLGFDFDPDAGIYTLKFVREGNVIWVDVDGRSGRVVGRTDR